MITERDLIRPGNLKLTVFESFPFEELQVIAKWMQKRGYAVFWVDNGNIVFQKIENRIEPEQYIKMNKKEGSQ